MKKLIFIVLYIQCCYTYDALVRRKNTILKETRHISFERIEFAIANNLLGVTHGEDPNYPHQYRFYIEIDSYVWVVPAVRTGDDYFLKTAYPSRRAQKQYNS